MIYRCLECGFRFSEAVWNSTDLSGKLLIPDADTSMCPTTPLPPARRILTTRQLLTLP